MVHHIEGSQLNEEVLKSNKDLIVVDFFATWCMPCQMLSPILEKASDTFSDAIDVFKINIDESQEIAMRYGIVSVPTLIFFKNGEEIERQVGLLEENELDKLLKQLI